MNSLPSYRLKMLIVAAAGILFLALSLISVYYQAYIIWALPVAMLLVIISLTRIDLFYLMVLFFVPLSVQLRFMIPDPPADLFIPTEPMLLILLLILLFRMFVSRELRWDFFSRPESIIILVMLGWMALTTITSQSAVVSVKALVTRLWFVAGFYFISLHLFQIPGFAEKALKVLILAILPVIVYNIVRLAGMGLLNQQAAHATMWPFYNDHTSFGAAIAFIIPYAFYFMLVSKKRIGNLLWIVVLMILLGGLVFSYSRAAWLSLIVGSFVALVLAIRVPAKLILLSSVLIVTITVLSWSSILLYLQGNRQGSSADLSSHIRSSSNITTDASNLERINRWKSAYRMFLEKPLMGWGPGTYQFYYAPYQMSGEKTIISTNFGDRGNAHSEYFGAAVETGIPGALIYILLLTVVITRGAAYSYNRRKGKDRMLMIASVTGLVTYVIHGLLNNFLDTDKLSAPFWISIALIVVISYRPSPGNKATD